MKFKKEIEGIAMKLPTILALPANSDRRLRQQAFMASAMASRDEAKLSQAYYAAETVMNELSDMLRRTLKQT